MGLGFKVGLGTLRGSAWAKSFWVQNFWALGFKVRGAGCLAFAVERG